MLSSNLFSFAFQSAVDKVASFDNYVANSVGKSFTTSMNSWLGSHPLIYWLAHHPLISILIMLISGVLMIRLLLTIYRAIAHSIDRMWVFILRSPWLLVKVLFGWEKKSPDLATKNVITNYEVTNNPEQLQTILNRLDQIQQQQAQILLDLAQLKQASSVVSIEPKQQKLLK